MRLGNKYRQNMFFNILYLHHLYNINYLTIDWYYFALVQIICVIFYCIKYYITKIRITKKSIEEYKTQFFYFTSYSFLFLNLKICLSLLLMPMLIIYRINSIWPNFFSISKITSKIKLKTGYWWVESKLVDKFQFFMFKNTFKLKIIFSLWQLFCSH